MKRFALLCLLVAASGCSCDEGPIAPPVRTSCELQTDCSTEGSSQVYRLGQCAPERCETDASCCPGSFCSRAGECISLLTTCSDDEACGIAGQECIDARGGKFCGYPNGERAENENGAQACDSTADCGDGRACVGRRCVIEAPCSSGCEAGEICDIDSNSCYKFDCGADFACGAGEVAVLEDPDVMSGSMCCAVVCTCATLPPIATTEFGWYADVALKGEKVLVGAYDTEYGDLVLVEFDREGRRTGLNYIDGTPSTGTLVGDPNGPRAGLVEAGPDVGEHTSIAVDTNGIIHLAYHDVDNGTLKYARSEGDGWLHVTVDDVGQTGLYTDIAISPSGRPTIAYMMADGPTPGNETPMTGVKLASARTGVPSAGSDFVIEAVDMVERPELTCGGGCAEGAACVDLGTGAECVSTTIGCGGCEDTEACVTNQGVAECIEETRVSVSDDLVDGLGLFTSLAFDATDGLARIAYYDRISRSLKLATATTPSGFAIEVLDGQDAENPRDVGAHASIAAGPGGALGVAYMDATNDELRYIDLRTRSNELVDDGITPPNISMVGADASLIFDSQGRPAIAYQDPTNLDVVYARRSGEDNWSTEVLAGAPFEGEAMGEAAGFYVSQAAADGTAFISNVTVRFDEDGRRLSLELLRAPLE